MKKHLTSFFLTLFIFGSINAQIAKTQVVMINATIQATPPVIRLHWPSETWAGTWDIYRRDSQTANDWGSPVAQLAGNVFNYSDSSVQKGTAYEYKIAKAQGATVSGLGYLYTGIEYRPDANAGNLLLIIDSAYVIALSPDIDRLIEDLRGEGWNVWRRYVARNASPVSVRSEIFMVNGQLNNTLRTVLILGHVPVPYSGNFSGNTGFPPPDGHVEGSGNHTGAWPADTYYGDIDGSWTDNAVNLTTGAQTRHHNVPGDGKFDPSKIPSDLELEVGRIDLYKMDAFSVNDTDLVRKYLLRNHLWRSGNLKSVRRGLIDNNFTGLNLASTGYHNLTAILPRDSVFDNRDYKTSLKATPYLWAYGCGAGSYTSCNGIGTTSDFAADSFQNIFTMLAGSYFGDWDIKNNLLRAPLANSALVSFWGGIPKWYVHHMAMGIHIGYGTRLTMNNDLLYTNGNFNYAHRGVHMALMGDPTIKLHYIQPIKNLVVTSTSGIVNLTWDASPAPGAGYFVYRVDSVTNHHSPLHANIQSNTSFSDPDNHTTGRSVYAVRAAVLDQTSGGNYYATSRSTFAGTYHEAIPPVSTSGNSEIQAISIFPNPASQMVSVRFYAPGENDLKVAICDIAGKIITTESIKSQTGLNKHTIRISDIPAGLYFLQISENSKTLTYKWIKN